MKRSFRKRPVFKKRKPKNVRVFRIERQFRGQENGGQENDCQEIGYQENGCQEIGGQEIDCQENDCQEIDCQEIGCQENGGQNPVNVCVFLATVQRTLFACGLVKKTVFRPLFDTFLPVFFAVV